MNKKLIDELTILRFVWRSAGGNHGKMVGIMITQIFTALVPAMITVAAKWLLDDETVSISALLTKSNLTLIILVTLLTVISRQISGLLTGYAMANTKRNVETACIRKFAILPHAYVMDAMDNRSIMALSIESDMVSCLIPMIYRSFLRAPVTIVAFVCILVFISPSLTLITLGLVSFVAIGTVLFRKSVKRLSKYSFDKIGDMHQRFSEWVQGYKVFVTSNATGFIDSQLRGIVENITNASKKLALIGAFQAFILELITFLIAVLFIRYASVDQGFSIGIWIAFPTAIFFIRNEILCMINGYIQLTKTESAASRLMEIMNYDTPAGVKKTLGQKIQRIELKDVSYAYKNSSDFVLNGANAVFEKGFLNTIVGHSGIGKTTCINLCMNLREPQSGMILYNDKNIREVDEADLLGHIALVEQEPFIFEGTLAENIFFDRQPDIGRAYALFEKFRLTHLVHSPAELLSNRIGLKERQLSTGEKQRIAVIRALVRDPDVIFFDEVTSNIDALTANIIIEFLGSIIHEKLVICISHDEQLIHGSTKKYRITDGKIYRE